MKQGWEIKKLGEVCKKITNIKWNEIEETTSFPYIDLSAVDRENSSIHDYEYIDISNAPSRAKQIVKVGDILFATTRPMVKRACIIPYEFNNAIASTGFCVLRPQGAVLSEWIYHNIKSNRFYKYIEPIQKGVSYPAVTDNEVKDFCIPIPPREEQERIVAELDCLSGVIERKREQLRELDALAQSIFYQMFGDPITNEKGWEVKPLKTICKKLFAGGDVPKNNFSETRTQQYPIPIYSNGVGLNALYGFTDIAKVEDISLTISGRGTIGYCAIRTAPFYPIVRLIVATPITTIIQPIILKYIIDWLCLKGTGGAIPQLTIPMIKDKMIIVPPLALQQEFTEKIEAIEKQKELISQSITQTEELFNSRMDYYFN